MGPDRPSVDADTAALPREFARIATYLRPLAAGLPGAYGLNDDAAVLDIPAGRSLVVTTDAMVEHVHFLPDDPPGDVAAKLLRVNLSDLAAMGADPLAYSLTLCLPRRCDDAWLAAFCDGLAADQARFGIGMLGGDSVSTAGPIVLSVTAMGTVPSGAGVRRSGARAGDKIYVTGTIGDAFLGLQLRLAQSGIAGAWPIDIDARDAAFLIERLRLPTPRIALAPALRDLARAAVDVSDGLIADVGHLARASGITVRLDAAALPLSQAAAVRIAEEPAQLVGLMTGGDDYELAVAVAPDAQDAFVRAAAMAGVTVTAIGVCSAPTQAEPAGSVAVVDRDGAALSIGAKGWSHG